MTSIKQLAEEIDAIEEEKFKDRLTFYRHELRDANAYVVVKSTHPDNKPGNIITLKNKIQLRFTVGTEKGKIRLAPIYAGDAE